jgi:hypothetical protein
VTERLQTAFFSLINGTVPDRYGWLSPVYATAAVK